MSQLSDCLAFTFQEEGGYTNDPNDPGGPTKFGITQQTLAIWRGDSVTAEDVQALTINEATAIYGTKYFNAMHCAQMPVGVDPRELTASLSMKAAARFGETIAVSPSEAASPAAIVETPASFEQAVMATSLGLCVKFFSSQ